MQSASHKLATLTLLLIAFIPLRLPAQNKDSLQISRPNLFLDCFRCPERYVKENMDIVSFVRDPAVAQIQLIVTRANAGGGTEFTMKLVGLGKFKGINNNIVYFSASTDTEQEERESFLQHLRLALIPFIVRTSLKRYIDVTYENFQAGKTRIRVDDPWNHWIFDISLDVSFEGEETRHSYELEGRLSADRVTKEWKFDLDAMGRYKRLYVDLEVDGDDKDTLTTVKTFSFLKSSKRLDGLFVKSLSQHWSAGGAASISTSTFDNIDLRVEAGPAVEFNIFPYSEYNHHEFSFVYKITPTYVEYNDTTIYNKIDQFLVEQSLGIDYELIETWGEINLGIEAMAYLHDFSKNRINFDGRIEFRVFRGFSVYIRGEYSLINAQLSLPKGDITNRKRLLQLREQKTGYSYELSFGLSFTFGSIYNSIVNPRFPRYF